MSDVESKKASLDLAKMLSSQNKINQEIQKGIEHGDKALKIKYSIHDLTMKKTRLDNKIVFERARFKDFKSRFPA